MSCHVRIEMHARNMMNVFCFKCLEQIREILMYRFFKIQFCSMAGPCSANLLVLHNGCLRRRPCALHVPKPMQMLFRHLGTW